MREYIFTRRSLGGVSGMTNNWFSIDEEVTGSTSGMYWLTDGNGITANGFLSIKEDCKRFRMMNGLNLYRISIK